MLLVLAVQVHADLSGQRGQRGEHPGGEGVGRFTADLEQQADAQQGEDRLRAGLEIE